MKAIILTRVGDGQPIRINPDHIVYYEGYRPETDSDCTRIWLGDSYSIDVRETSKQIDEKIAELPSGRSRSLFEDVFGPRWK